MLQDELYRNIPEYYPWMYLDGFTPDQILYAKRKQMRKNLKKENDESIDIRIVSTVKKYEHANLQRKQGQEKEERLEIFS